MSKAETYVASHRSGSTPTKWTCNNLTTWAVNTHIASQPIQCVLSKSMQVRLRHNATIQNNIVAMLSSRVSEWVNKKNDYGVLHDKLLCRYQRVLLLLLLLLLNEKIMVACCQRLRGHRTVSKVRASVLRTRNWMKEWMQLNLYSVLSWSSNHL